VRKSPLTEILSSQARYNDQLFNSLQLDGIQLTSSEFFDCVFRECSFVGSVINKCRFINCAFHECDLSLVQVPESSFSGLIFENSKVVGVNFAQADWPISGLGKPIRFKKTTLNHSTFIGLSLKGIQITDCAAVDVDFREADLSQADFTGTDLSESLFGSTNLSQADLSQARNYLIDPGKNELKHARFSLPEAMSLLYSMDIQLTDGEIEE
jgi:fluoroquinolone resistance protein